jgi:hypothetical protein
VTDPRLVAHGEILKLARVLGAEPDRLSYLERVDPGDLRRLREQVTDVLFDADLVALQRMASASRLLPAAVLAKIAVRVFGPLLCARVAGLLDPARGIDVAKRLPPGFLADVAIELDPRRANQIIAGVPVETIAAIAAELTGREDWITIGRFVDQLPDEAVSASLRVMTDAALLQVLFLLDDKTRIDHILELLPSSRFERLMRTAAEHDLWTAALDLLAHCAPGRRAQLVAEFARLPDSVRADAAAHAGGEDRLGDLLAG